MIYIKTNNFTDNFKKKVKGVIFENEFLKIRMINSNYPYLEMNKKGAVCIPFDSNLDLYILSKTRPDGETLLEFPRGFVEEGESHLDGGVRELQEETSLTALKAKYLGRIQPDTGIVNADVQIIAFLVDGLDKDSLSHYDKCDKETNHILKIPVADLDDYLLSAEVVDGYTLAGMGKFRAFLRQGILEEFGIGTFEL